MNVLDKTQNTELSNDNAGNIKHTLWEVPKYPLIELLEIQTRDRSQRLNITFSKPICYEMNLIDKMRANNYTGLVYPPIGMFAKTMDDKNNIGTIFVLYKTHIMDNTICINNLMFDTSKPFDKKDYQDFSIITPNDSLK